jgi:DNA-binding IclR family transcriptional regulator
MKHETTGYTVDQGEQKVTGALARGMKILDVIRNMDRPFSSTEIAHSCGFDASTTHRLLQVLHDNGYVIRDEASKRYFASPKVLFPLSVYNPLNEFRREGARTINRLRDETDQTTGFVLFCMNERILVEIAPGQNSLSPAYDTWLNSPPHASASGKVLLLSMTREERRAFLGDGPLPSYTEHTITEPEELEKDLAYWHDHGYVLAQDDYFDGLLAIGAPIWTDTGACIGCFFINALTATVPAEKVHSLGMALKASADLFSLGTPATHKIGRMFDAKPSPGFRRLRSTR